MRVFPKAAFCVDRNSTASTNLFGCCHQLRRLAITNTWKIFAFGAAAIAILAAANLEVKSHGRERLVTQVNYVQPTSFATNVYGSDAAISTYGLDPQRMIDW